MFNKEYKNAIVGLWYHQNTPFGNQKSVNRRNFYTAETPFFITDGIFIDVETYGIQDTIRMHINQRKLVVAPITISIASSCSALSGNATVTIKNTSQAAVSGTLQFIVKECGPKYSWPPRTFVDNVVRDMVPDENGEAITVNAGQSITKTRAFTINSSWVKDSCRLVAFVQKSNREIIEGCLSGLNEAAPIITSAHADVEIIKVRASKGAVMLYIPEKGKCAVTILDLCGREIANSTIQNNREWIQVPAGNYHGIILIRIRMADKSYITKSCLLN